MYTIYNEELCHHGILGMKWGIRRTPAQLGYPTPKPRKTADGKIGTYNTKGHVTKADYGITKSKLVKSNSESNDTNKHELSKFQKSLYRVNRKNNPEMSKEEAEREAIYQDRARKIAIAVAAGAVLAGTAYVIYKSKQENINPYKDFSILPGTKIQRITPFGDNDVREQFYGAVNKQDKRAYIYKMAEWKNTKLYKQEMVPKKPVKVAGIDTCKKLYIDLQNNDATFANALKRDYLFETPNYADFNRDMVVKPDLGKDNAFQLFQNALKKKGYGALIDHNDSKGIGWGTERPIIFFDQQSNLDSTVKSLGNETITKARNDYHAIKLGRGLADLSIVPISTIGASSAFTAGFFSFTGAKTNKEIIKEYKHLHPNSKLSDTEILDIFDKNK